MAAEQASEERKNESYDNPPYRHQEGMLFAKNGKVGERYVAADAVFTLVKVAEGSVLVRYHNSKSVVAISRHTEVEPFGPRKHSHLLERKESPEE